MWRRRSRGVPGDLSHTKPALNRCRIAAEVDRRAA
jgi:hypothetical protein